MHSCPDCFDRSAWIRLSVAVFALVVTSMALQLRRGEDSTDMLPVDADARTMTIPEKSIRADPNARPTNLDTLYALFEQIKIEQAKPLARQNYAEIKAALAEITARNSGSVALCAKYALEQLEPCNLPMVFTGGLYERKELQQIRERIAPAIQLPRECVVIGTLERRVVSGLSYARLLDGERKTIGYFRPAPSMLEDESRFIGHQVGLVVMGEVERNSAGRPFRYYTEIVYMDTK